MTVSHDVVAAIEGRKARLRNKDVASNPYAGGSPEWLCWQEGWFQADCELAARFDSEE